MQTSEAVLTYIIKHLVIFFKTRTRNQRVLLSWYLFKTHYLALSHKPPLPLAPCRHTQPVCRCCASKKTEDLLGLTIWEYFM